jgi:molecular chaperone GrpE
LSEHKPKKWNLNPAPPEDQASAPAAAPELVDPPASGDELSKLLAEKQELMNTLVRRQADFENYRKRVERERHADRHRGVESLIEHILPVLDAFDRALAGSDDPAYANYRKGFELIRKQLWESLSKQGLVRVESVGQEFNPHMHHAIERVETTEYADGTVIGEMQPGYIFHEKVLRPAMVRVAGAPEPHSASASKRDN